MRDFQVSLMSDDSSQNELTVLKVASASKNSQSQFFSDPVRVTGASLADIHRKMIAKLKLHSIDAVTLSLSLKLANDKTIVFADVNQLQSFDAKVDSLTSLISMRWQFIFNNEGEDHLHSVYLRISERPNPAMLLQRAMTLSSDDLENFDKEAMAPISCRVDFFDGRFSGELLSVVSEWVAALPKAEPTFGWVKWIDHHEGAIGNYVVGISPSICLAASVGVWLAVIPMELTQDLRFCVVWLIGTAICYFFSRYLSLALMRAFARNISRMNAVPVFNITSGDQQRLTKFLAKSHKSSLVAMLAAILYGGLKGVGLWFASYMLRAVV